MPSLQRDGDVYVLHLGDGENRFTGSWLAEASAALDEVERAPGPRALVTAASGKIYSNGLDLDWLLAHPGQQDSYLGAVQELLARVLAFPAVTVAAVQGHAFGAGAMLALAHDFRVMRADRGYWCLPEADLGLRLTVGFLALILARLAPQPATEATVTSRRYGGTDALAAGIVDQAVELDAVLPAAISVAAAQAGKPAASLAAIKSARYASALAALRSAPRY